MLLKAGQQLACYEIQAPVGAGGMAEVYRATDIRLHRTVAIKLLSNDLADETGRRRFQREAQAASSLNHPNIVTVHDVGDHDGRQYLVLEFVEGGTLRDWLQRSNRSWRQIAELLMGVAEGVATAHEAGILHRDIKPDNILVAGSGHAKLADFGLARLDPVPGQPTSHGSRGAHLTGTGVVMGTVGYMSPEQVEGRTLDARSDNFSFGVVLYEALTGCLPFAGESRLDLLQNILHEPAPPPDGGLPCRAAHGRREGAREGSSESLPVDPRNRGRPASRAAARDAKRNRGGVHGRPTRLVDSPPARQRRDRRGLSGHRHPRRRPLELVAIHRRRSGWSSSPI